MGYGIIGDVATDTVYYVLTIRMYVAYTCYDDDVVATRVLMPLFMVMGTLQLIIMVIRMPMIMLVMAMRAMTLIMMMMTTVMMIPMVMTAMTIMILMVARVMMRLVVVVMLIRMLYTVGDGDGCGCDDGSLFVSMVTPVMLMPMQALLMIRLWLL